jgi:hypothetical protein
MMSETHIVANGLGVEKASDVVFATDCVERFEWKELHGKDLRIFVGQDGGISVLSGRDIATGVLYILSDTAEKLKVWSVESHVLYDPAERNVFGIFSTKEKAESAAQSLRDHDAYRKPRCARGVGVSARSQKTRYRQHRANGTETER